MHFNTTNQQGLDLIKSNRNAISQKQTIVNYFKKNPNKELTPEQVHIILFSNKGIPLTSVRRAITTATKSNLLIKTNTQKKGLYGVLNYCWKLSQ